MNIQNEYGSKYSKLWIELEKEYDYESGSIYLIISGIRVETDEEEEKREADELAMKEERIKLERKQYEYLKKKFDEVDLEKYLKKKDI